MYSRFPDSPVTPRTRYASLAAVCPASVGGGTPFPRTSPSFPPRRALENTHDARRGIVEGRPQGLAVRNDCTSSRWVPSGVGGEEGEGARSWGRDVVQARRRWMGAASSLTRGVQKSKENKGLGYCVAGGGIEVLVGR